MADAVAIAYRQWRLERRMFWRNPTAAFFSFVLPLLFLFLFGAIFSGDQETLDVIVPGILGLSVMSTTFNALAMNITFLREEGVLAGVAANAVSNAGFQLVIVVLAGRLFFGIGWPKDWLELAVFAVVGVATLAALGVAFSHVIPNFDAAPAYTNIVFLPVIFISGVFYDVDTAPQFLTDIARVLPLTHVIDGFSAAMVTGAPLSEHAGDLAVVAAWGLVGAFFAVRGFSWESRRS
jgi:ABC-2 type transport system permease protein